MRLRTAAAYCAVLVVAPCFSAGVNAQAYPAKPVRVIQVCPVGCLPDLLGRAMAQTITVVFGRPILNENRPGANGNIAMEQCAKAAPDGYTLCMTANVIMSLNPFAYDRIPFEPREMVPVVSVCNLDQAIGVNTSVPAKNVKELIELSRAKPDTITWGSLGKGSTAHLYLEWLNAKADAHFLHVPYAGSPQASQALAGGEVMVTTLTPGLFTPLIAAGKARVIAVVSGAKRSALMPDVPTLGEQGYPLDFRNWFALFGPKGTPPEAVQRWNVETNKLLADKAFTDKYFLPNGVTPTGGTPEELAAIARDSRVAGEELAKMAKLKFD